MPKDYAARGQTRPSGARKKRNKSNTRKPATGSARVLFHSPSFAVGVIIGAAIVILAAYGPQMINSSSTQPQRDDPQHTPEPKVTFEFPERLRNTTVAPDPEPYAVPEPATGAQPTAIMIQAASFRNPTDADRLRADLLLQNLQARTTSQMINGQRWYRVVVGPFDRKVDADRAMTRLRQQGLSAIVANNTD